MQNRIPMKSHNIHMYIIFICTNVHNNATIHEKVPTSKMYTPLLQLQVPLRMPALEGEKRVPFFWRSLVSAGQKETVTVASLKNHRDTTPSGGRRNAHLLWIVRNTPKDITAGEDHHATIPTDAIPVY
jgi:hypothetical protein